MRTRLFVYGSLKRGFANHGHLARAVVEGSATTGNGFELRIVGDYPAMIRCDEGVVIGEIYAVDDDLVERLDAFEGCPTLYQRESIELEDGSRAAAYVMSRAAATRHPRLAGSEWTLDHEKGR